MMQVRWHHGAQVRSRCAAEHTHPTLEQPVMVEVGGDPVSSGAADGKQHSTRGHGQERRHGHGRGKTEGLASGTTYVAGRLA